MTADFARQNTTGMADNLLLYISRIDDQIQKCANMGGRQIEAKNYRTDYADDIVKHYRENGFKVTHYISPFVEIKIAW